MGLIQLLIFCVAVVLLVAVAVWFIGYMAPEHPVVIDKALWVLAVVLILIAIFRAIGGHDIAVPKVP